MAIESALIEPVVDAIMALLRRGENVQLHRNAEKAVREAIRELLLATPDENKAAARIAIAKAAGLLSEDVVLAEEMLQMPVRVGIPQHVTGLGEVVGNPVHATGVGLLLIGSQIENPRRPMLPAGRAVGFLSRLKNWYRGEF